MSLLNRSLFNSYNNYFHCSQSLDVPKTSTGDEEIFHVNIRYKFDLKF